MITAALDVESRPGTLAFIVYTQPDPGTNQCRLLVDNFLPQWQTNVKFDVLFVVDAEGKQFVYKRLHDPATKSANPKPMELVGAL